MTDDPSTTRDTLSAQDALASDDPYVALADVLMDLEYELRRASLWQSEPPSDEALASTQPFGLDTLTLPQWLQFILLPRFYGMIEQRLTLPEHCAIAPMAEESLSREGAHVLPVIAQLQRLDRLLSE